MHSEPWLMAMSEGIFFGLLASPPWGHEFSWHGVRIGIPRGSRTERLAGAFILALATTLGLHFPSHVVMTFGLLMSLVIVYFVWKLRHGNPPRKTGS